MAASFTTCVDNGQYVEDVGRDGEYFISPVLWHRSQTGTGSLTNLTSAEFDSRYTEAFGISASYQAAASFVAPLIPIEAIERASSIDADSVMSILRDDEFYVETFYKNITFDSNMQADGEAVVVSRYPNVLSVASVVYPIRLRSEEYIFPMPTWARRDCDFHTTCGENGECLNDGTCQCDEGWTGLSCREIDTSDRSEFQHTIIYSVLFVVIFTLCGVAVIGYYIHIRRQRKEKTLDMLTKKQRELLKVREEDIRNLTGAWKIEWHQLAPNKRIAAGGYGEVWKGSLNNQIAVAIKFIYDSDWEDLQDDPEICFLQRARHENLVFFYGCGCVDSVEEANSMGIRGKVFVVLEYCGIGDLRSLLYNHIDIDITWHVRLSLLRDMSAGMNYLHTVR